MFGSTVTRSSLAIGLAAGALWLGAESADPQTNFQATPRAMQVFSLFPTGAQRGTAVDVEILGANLDSLDRIESNCPGLRTTVKTRSYLKATARFDLDSTVEPGLCRVRFFSPLGPSNLQVFRAGDLREAFEAEPNDTTASAEKLDFPALINARLDRDEDIDFYLVQGRAGAQFTAEVFGARNGSGLNAEMYLLDESGRRVAVGDGEEGADPVIRHRFKDDRFYHLAVRGTFGVLNISFPTGHPAYVYQLLASMTAPRVDAVRPFRLTAAREEQIRLTGESLASVDTLAFSDAGITASIVERSEDQILARVNMNAQVVGRRQMWTVAGGVRSKPVNLLITRQPDRFEVEPNDTLVDATPLQFDDAVEGQISKKADRDIFSFMTSEAGLWVWEVQSGAYPTLLDAHAELLDESGKVLQSAAASPGGDLKIEHKFDKPARVYLRISQAVLDYFGPAYNYRAFARKARPTFSLTPGSRSPAPKELKGSDRIFLGQGAEFKVPLRIQWREDLEHVGAAIRIEVDGLPRGVTADALIVKPEDGKRDKEKSPLISTPDVVLRAAGDAPLGVTRIQIRGTAEWPGHKEEVKEAVQVNASGSYVLSLSGGVAQQIDERYLTIIKPTRWELRPEIGDERYPSRLLLRPGSSKIVLISVLTREPKLPEFEFEAENLPRGVRISAVEAFPDRKQYQLRIDAAPDAEKGWVPLVIIAAKPKEPGAGTVTTPQFGLTVQ